MKVHEVVRALQKEIDDGNGELEVITEGCDCHGDVAKVTVESGYKEKYVFLSRS